MTREEKIDTASAIVTKILTESFEMKMILQALMIISEKENMEDKWAEIAEIIAEGMIKSSVHLLDSRHKVNEILGKENE